MTMNRVTVLAALSMVLFVACLPLNSFRLRENDYWRGWNALAFGLIGVGPPTNWIWFANPLLIASWFAIYRHDALQAILCSFASLALGATFLLTRRATVSAEGSSYPVTAYKAGYWLWLASMVTSCCTALLMNS
jgi:hypothetical protein